MAQNKAAQDLANLTQATQPTLENAERRAAQAREAGMQGARPIQRSGDAQAQFALPEAIATGVVGSVLLGPLGGLVIGAAQGFLGKQERQSILDDLARENAALTESKAVFDDTFDTLAENATNPNDLEQLGALRGQYEAAYRLAFSGSPRLQATGMDQLNEVYSQLNEYTDLQESQRIAAETADAQARRDMEREVYNRYNELLGEFDQDSGEFEASIAKGNEVLALIEDGTPASLTAATIGLAKLLDPTGVVRPGEAEQWATIGSLGERVETFIEQLRTGEPLNPDQAREMAGLINTVMDERRKIQSIRETRYLERAERAEIPENYWADFQLETTLPSSRFTPPEPDENEAPSKATPGKVAGGAVDSVVNAVTGAPQTAADAINAIADTVTDFGNESGQANRRLREQQMRGLRMTN